MQRLTHREAPPANLLISGARLFDGGSGLEGVQLDVRVVEGAIAEIGPDLEADGAETIDAAGLTMTPGLIDPHVHLRTPGDEDEEDIASGTRAAAAGGFVAILAMPNTDPVVDSAAVLSGLIERAGEQAAVPTGFFAAISRGLEGRELVDMAELAARGAAGFSDDGRPVERAGMLRRALQYSRVTGLKLTLHEEDMTLTAGSQMHEGAVSAELGLHGYPGIGESVMVGRDLQIARYEHAPLHLCHISAAESVAEIRRAKELGVEVTAEVSPHHLCLTDELVRDLDPAVSKMNPPLRSAADRAALIEALADGTLDCIATDHAPHRTHEKEVPFEAAPNGVIGLETAFAAVYTELVAPGLVPLCDRDRTDVGRPGAGLRSARPGAAHRRPRRPRALGSVRELGGRAAVRLPLAQLRIRRAHAAGPLHDHDRSRHRRSPAGRGGTVTALLVLEDGTVLEGEAYGGTGTAVGELVFITSMTGYQEIVTDPSFAGQMITFTQPMIGNYGVESDASESDRPQARAVIVREGRNAAPAGRVGFSDWLAEHDVIGIQGLDTRMLTRRLRDGGTVRAAVCSDGTPVPELLALIGGEPEMAGQALAGEVSCRRAEQLPALAPERAHVAVLDYGVKGSIVRILRERGARVTVLPWDATAEQVLELRPDGVLLGNGPGDPAALPGCVSEVRELVGQVPVFGICLGHQLLGRALGLETFKLRFGHRGANHPVLDVDTGRVLVTAQNHGFAVRVPDGGGDLETDFGPARVTHVSLYDGTVEGLALRELPAWSMQFHPEASPGPHDAREALERFVGTLTEATVAQA